MGVQHTRKPQALHQGRREAWKGQHDFPTWTFQDCGASPSSLYLMEAGEAQSLGTQASSTGLTGLGRSGGSKKQQTILGL